MHDSDEFVCGTTLRVKWIQKYAVEQLEAAKRGELPVRTAVCRYLKQGAGAGFSTGELVDWLGVSSPSLLSQAGYLDAEAAEVMDVLGLITDQEIEQTRVGPEPYLP
jgi:hypothetical protein